ncbi:MAG: hypothetical protein Q8O67_31765 [Deltaproteobacteria bacterium]|nr:hypothetical protein [Deltaproteobacteria bacterium]
MVNQVDGLRRGHNAQLRIGAAPTTQIEERGTAADVVLQLVANLDLREALLTKAALIEALADGRTCGAADDAMPAAGMPGPYVVYVALYWRRYRPRTALGRTAGLRTAASSAREPSLTC